MRPLQIDLSIYKKFNFENTPVGVKYLTEKPEGIKQLDKTLALCEMLKEAQHSSEPFYITEENEDCFGKKMLGMEKQPSSTGNGQIGVEFGLFQDARANWRIYQYQVQLKDAVKYVVFAPLEKIDFEPDMLFIMGTVDQAEIIMRAMSYSTGEQWNSNLTGIGACSWLFAYPYLSGKVNYAITGMSFGMKVKQVFPPGWILIAIPYDWISVITKNLNEMQWELPAYTEGKEKFKERETEVISRLFGKK